MMTLIAHLLVNSLAVLAGAYLLPGIRIADAPTALLVVIVLGLANAVLRPIVVLLTLPLTVLTLGLFLFVINALMVLLVDRLVPGFSADSFLWALAYSLVVSLVATFLNAVRRAAPGA
jgi:putative membrane protein